MRCYHALCTTDPVRDSHSAAENSVYAFYRYPIIPVIGAWTAFSHGQRFKHTRHWGCLCLSYIGSTELGPNDAFHSMEGCLFVSSTLQLLSNESAVSQRSRPKLQTREGASGDVCPVDNSLLLSRSLHVSRRLWRIRFHCLRIGCLLHRQYDC